jgi:hypothetical protein
MDMSQGHCLEKRTTRLWIALPLALADTILIDEKDSGYQYNCHRVFLLHIIRLIAQRLRLRATPSSVLVLLVLSFQ